MMEVYNVISNIPFMLIVIVLTYSMGSGFWNLILAMSLTGWIGIAYTIRVQIVRYRDLEYNLGQPNIRNTNFENCYEKYFASIGICYRDTNITVTSKLYFLRSFPFLLRTWSSNHSSKFGTVDF